MMVVIETRLSLAMNAFRSIVKDWRRDWAPDADGLEMMLTALDCAIKTVNPCSKCPRRAKMLDVDASMVGPEVPLSALGTLVTVIMFSMEDRRPDADEKMMAKVPLLLSVLDCGAIWMINLLRVVRKLDVDVTMETKALLCTAGGAVISSMKIRKGARKLDTDEMTTSELLAAPVVGTADIACFKSLRRGRRAVADETKEVGMLSSIALDSAVSPSNKMSRRVRRLEADEVTSTICPRFALLELVSELETEEIVLGVDRPITALLCVAALMLNCLRGLDGAGARGWATATMRDNRDGFDDTAARTAKSDMTAKSFEADQKNMVGRGRN